MRSRLFYTDGIIIIVSVSQKSFLRLFFVKLDPTARQGAQVLIQEICVVATECTMISYLEIYLRYLASQIAFH